MAQNNICKDFSFNELPTWADSPCVENTEQKEAKEREEKATSPYSSLRRAPFQPILLQSYNEGPLSFQRVLQLNNLSSMRLWFKEFVVLREGEYPLLLWK